MRGTDGQLTAYVKVAWDVTRTKESEETNRRLGAELTAGRIHEERMRKLLSRLITVQEEERRRIARDLHDHLGQQMTALHLQLELLARQVAGDPQAALDRVHQVQRVAKQLETELDFYTWELRPGALYSLGLVPALTDFVTTFSRNYQLPVAFECVQMPETRLHTDHEVNLYRIAQEALNNTYKHARASSADVLLQYVDNRVVLTLHDDGVGFDAETLQWAEGDRGMGLVGMRERAMLIGGTLEIETAPQQGTTIIVSAPAVFRSGEGGSQ
jgi:signal transduction histidine kinase